MEKAMKKEGWFYVSFSEAIEMFTGVDVGRIMYGDKSLNSAKARLANEMVSDDPRTMSVCAILQTEALRRIARSLEQHMSRLAEKDRYREKLRRFANRTEWLSRAIMDSEQGSREMRFLICLNRDLRELYVDLDLVGEHWLDRRVWTKPSTAAQMPFRGKISPATAEGVRAALKALSKKRKR